MLSLLLCCVAQVPAPVEDSVLDNGLRLRVDAVPGARAACWVLVAPVGSDHDPDGEAGLARCIGAAWSAWLARARPTGDAGPDLRIEVTADATWAWAIAPPAAAVRVAAAWAALLSAAPLRDADACALARARARLGADDERLVFPGAVHRWAVRGRLLAGEPEARCGAGEPEEIAALDDRRLLERALARYGPPTAVAYVLGGDAGAAAELERALGALPARARAPARPRARGAAWPASRVSPFVGGPFVTAGALAPRPGDEGFAAFLVAAAIVQERVAAAGWQFRGGEDRASFAPFAYDPLAGERSFRIQRRGRDGRPAAEARAEIERVLHELVERPPGAEAVAAAAGARAAELAPGPPAERAAVAGTPRALWPRARCAAAVLALGWPGDLPARLASVDADAVRAVLHERFAVDAMAWVETVPATPVAGAPRSAGRR